MRSEGSELGEVLAHVESDGRRWWGFVVDGGLAPFGQFASTADVLEAVRARPAHAHGGEDPPVPAESVTFLSPVTAPARIICQGANYADHRRESGYSSRKPPFNTIFTKADSSLCGACDDIVRPARVALLDYEAELGLVIGAPIRGPLTVGPDDLPRYVGALVVANDVSARDIQIPEEQWVKGKSFRTFCPTGPYLYVVDEGDRDVLDRLELRLWVNGELRQAASVADLLYKPHETLSELSGVMDLAPGDLILTGTPGGVAIKAPPPLVRKLGQLIAPEKRIKGFLEAQATNPAYLQPGDVVRTTIFSRDGRVNLGTQVNRVVDADGSRALAKASGRERVTGAQAVADAPLQEAPAGSPAPVRFQHAVFYVRDLSRSQAFYQDIFDVQFSARNHPDSSAAMRLVGHTMMFFSFGHYHHDICLVQNPAIDVDNEEWLHFTVRARSRAAFEAIADRAAARGIRVSRGRVLPIHGLTDDAVHFRDPDGHVVEVVAPPAPGGLMAKRMTRGQTLVSPILKLKPVRELILLGPTLSGKRSSNKTQDYGVFEDSRAAGLESVSIYVTDIERSRAWYERVLSARHVETIEGVTCEYQPGVTLTCCVLDLAEQPRCLVLIRRMEGSGRIAPVSTDGFFHIAFEMGAGHTAFEMARRLREIGVEIAYGPVTHNSKPGGDGESGGNTAVYAYDPDGHYLEFFHGMDTKENYRERRG